MDKKISKVYTAPSSQKESYINPTPQQPYYTKLSIFRQGGVACFLKWLLLEEYHSKIKNS